MAQATAPKPPTKTEIMNSIAEQTGLAKKDVAAVFEALATDIQKAIGKRNSPGAFTIPGLMKIQVRKTPAKPKRKVRNPATGEEIWAEPKKASKKVKVTPLKALKDMVA